MNALFNLENPVFAWIEKAVESAYLNILWFFCSLPILQSVLRPPPYLPSC